MIKKILLGVVGAIVVIIALGFVLPDRAALERDIVINAPPEKVYALISDFNAWQSWSPWAKIDPDADISITGAGVGHAMRWESDHPEVRSGVQTITALEENAAVTTHVDFGEMGGADATLRLEPVVEGVHVVWSFDTNMREGAPLWMKPVATYMGFFMDTMLGPTYEEGLQNLKAAAEADA